jgi:hypothetical protein
MFFEPKEKFLTKKELDIARNCGTDESKWTDEQSKVMESFYKNLEMQDFKIKKDIRVNPENTKKLASILEDKEITDYLEAEKVVLSKMPFFQEQIANII